MDKISAQELRIGNKLNDTHGRILTVNEIKNNCVGCHYKGQQNTTIEGIRYSSFPYEDLRPIVLTPELLERCGFEEPVRNIYRLTLFKGDFLYLCLYKVNNNWCAELTSFGTAKPLPKLNSLHQLQNLYYALTTIELDVKM